MGVAPAAIELTSGAGVVLSILVLSSLFLLWVVSLFLIVSDTISVGAKLLWFVFVTCVAPVAIPVYLMLRHHRHSHTATSSAA